jgi:hydroxymethylglutaryl-CoA lyase
MTDAVEIVEVGPRDGLQNEPGVFATAKKIELIRRLLDAGLRRIEVASFVHPKLVPQMADAEAVVAGLPEVKGATYIGLVLNQKGFERALATRARGRGIGEIGCVAVASDSFGQKNQGQTSAESVKVCTDILRAAKKEGVPAQVTISASFGCPFEGLTPPGKVIAIVKELAESEPKEIAIADTIGAAVPSHVEDVFASARDAAPGIPLRGHFHNTRNTGIANAWAAYRAGAKAVDSSIGGLGGCPFAPNATGNTATEDVAFLFERSSVETGLSLPALIAITRWLEGELGRALAAMVSRAGPFPKDQ